MTNYEIIRREAIDNGIYSEEEVERFEMQMLDLPLHTFAFWKKHGYYVKSGEKAVIRTRLWKLKNTKKKDEIPDDVDPIADPSHFFLASAYLFDISQVARGGV